MLQRPAWFLLLVLVADAEYARETIQSRRYSGASAQHHAPTNHTAAQHHVPTNRTAAQHHAPKNRTAPRPAAPPHHRSAQHHVPKDRTGAQHPLMQRSHSIEHLLTRVDVAPRTFFSRVFLEKKFKTKLHQKTTMTNRRSGPPAP
jgi:hypothetical protein